MNLCSKALIEIAKAILFINIETISINCSYTHNSTIYPCLEFLVERFMTSVLMVNFFILGAKTAQSSGSCFCLLGMDYILSLLIQ